ncbi:hypothetical protein SAVCW2_37980 [Streptomyces avermitilis]|uniref:Uncharacterized protein n=1 Tax=Streptomyces avermitilis TaxID=33903 RepID=A0A4D4MTW4_STRAX|nr:hypothetical protein SAVMC3_48120 [Streptomyces avermitilis]GDY75620.1 hypothetical protein SAV31267_051050 [Streptomyces avermitilis]GDY84599.1 hypothetical protein SAVCW2_37980 [Streptomyces avermitilis]
MGEDGAWDATTVDSASASRRSGNTQARKSRNRRTVAARLAAMRTASSVACAGLEVAAFSAASEPLVRASPIPKTTRPCAWWRTAPPRPRTPKVRRRLAAVLATAETSRASALAICEPVNERKPL